MIGFPFISIVVQRTCVFAKNFFEFLPHRSQRMHNLQLNSKRDDQRVLVIDMHTSDSSSEQKRNVPTEDDEGGRERNDFHFYCRRKKMPGR
jgi:hypothetical protein